MIYHIILKVNTARKRFDNFNNEASCLSSTKQCLIFLLICFARENKGFCQSSLGNEVDFTNRMNVSPNILAKN